MKHLLSAILFLALVAGSFFAGSWFNDQQTRKASGLTPQPVTTGSDNGADTEIDMDSSLPPGTVRITPERQQMVGVRTAIVEKAAGEHIIRAVGRVAPDEKRVYRLVAGTDGWIRETYANDTGTLVKKDERLASFYSPLFRASQLAYISLLSSSPEDRFQSGGRQALAPSQLASVSLQTYIDALESLGMSEKQMKEIASTKQVTDKVFILAPATGFIIARNVSPGQRFDKGAEWYQIANLDRVWILADLFPNDAGNAKPGMNARVTLPGQNKQFHATVTKVLPQLDPGSRTLKVRLELDNPDHFLRPDMFVNVEFPVVRSPALTVQADAILESGLRKTVFVERGNGYFEPREVETGWRHGNQVEITMGLDPGERIAVSGNFLIDSESKLSLSASGMQALLVKDPVCGQEVSPRKTEKAGLKAGLRGKTYYFHSEECKQKFQKDPGRYAGKPDQAEPPPQPASAPQPMETKGYVQK
ncbi:MAG: efflux RND transporter periplasmic adaptor subunit [Deltaproteobacteria bacterium]|nr:efflux RND transporter periplasmic adaptor subunit [Deltaproteobacteria bacterium]